MSTWEIIDSAVEILEKENAEYAILQCNSTYPAPYNELNLNVIPVMKERYGCVIGYSGHEFGLEPSVVAVAMGAQIIERHITLDRTMWGTDQMCSVEPQGLIKLVRGVRELNSALGDGIKIVTKTEIPIREKLRK